MYDGEKELALKYLYCNNFNINYKDSYNNTVLIWVFYNDLETFAIKILDNPTLNVNLVNNNNKSPLILCCIN
jgi:hypothetical protein